MELNSRCVKILRETSKVKDGLSAAALINELGITRRILYYDLNKINDWLKASKLGKVEVSGGRLSLQTDYLRKIDGVLGSFSAYVFSVEERRAIEILTIALSAAPVTSGHLQSLLDVSQNTILNDVKEWKAMLDPLLGITTGGKRGYSLSGEEAAARRLIGSQFEVLQNEYPRILRDNLLQNSLAELTGNRGVDFLSLVKKGVDDYERSLGTRLATNDTAFEEAMILAACIRCVKGFSYPMDIYEKDTLKRTKEYGAVQHIVGELADAKIAVGSNEAFFITMLFLGIKNFDFESSGAENDFIQKFAVKLVDNFEQIAGVSFEEKSAFLKRLCMHIRPMYYRLKYGVRAGGELSAQIKSMFASVYEFTRQAVKNTDSDIGGLISEEELAYLCIYMASYLREGHDGLANRRQKILIICGAGVATSVLLREQVVELLGDAFEYDLLPARRVEEQDLSGYCLIVTTVPIEAGEVKVIHTGPILSEESKDCIINSICNTGVYFSAGQKAAEILEVVKKKAHIPDETQLMRELVRYTIGRERADEYPLAPPGLGEILRDRRCVRISDADTLYGAIRDVCGLIDDNKAAQERMAEQLYVQIQGRGANYNANGVALAFLGKKAGEIGLGIVILRSPLIFSDFKVNMLVVLATVDNSTHHPLLLELYRVMNNRRFVRSMITAANSETAEDILTRHAERAG